MDILAHLPLSTDIRGGSPTAVLFRAREVPTAPAAATAEPPAADGDPAAAAAGAAPPRALAPDPGAARPPDAGREQARLRQRGRGRGGRRLAPVGRAARQEDAHRGRLLQRRLGRGRGEEEEGRRRGGPALHAGAGEPGGEERGGAEGMAWTVTLLFPTKKPMTCIYY